MSKIADLLAELSRNDDRQPCYNGVKVEETEIGIKEYLINYTMMLLLSCFPLLLIRIC